MAMLTIEPLHSEFGAWITGIDLCKPLPAAAVEEIRAAIDEYSFLCFPDQPLNDDLQLAFTRNLGEPEPFHANVGFWIENRVYRCGGGVVSF